MNRRLFDNCPLVYGAILAANGTQQQTLLRHLPERLINGFEGCASLTLDLRSNSLQTLVPQTIRSNNSLSITSTRHLAGTCTHCNPIDPLKPVVLCI
jgi:hypothetical protein